MIAGNLFQSWTALQYVRLNVLKTLKKISFLGIPKGFTKCTGKHLCWVLCFDKIEGLKRATGCFWILSNLRQQLKRITRRNFKPLKFNILPVFVLYLQTWSPSTQIFHNGIGSVVQDFKSFEMTEAFIRRSSV